MWHVEAGRGKKRILTSQTGILLNSGHAVSRREAAKCLALNPVRARGTKVFLRLRLEIEQSGAFRLLSWRSLIVIVIITPRS